MTALHWPPRVNNVRVRRGSGARFIALGEPRKCRQYSGGRAQGGLTLSARVGSVRSRGQWVCAGAIRVPTHGPPSSEARSSARAFDSGEVEREGLLSCLRTASRSRLAPGCVPLRICHILCEQVSWKVDRMEIRGDVPERRARRAPPPEAGRSRRELAPRPHRF